MGEKGGVSSLYRQVWVVVRANVGILLLASRMAAILPLAEGMGVLPVLLASFTNSPARGEGEAPGPVAWSPPRGGGGLEERAGLDRLRG